MMKLAASSHARIETFLREHLQDPELQLPPITISHGCVARWLTETFKVGAITIGRHVFISPRHVKHVAEGRRELPGWLVTHEAVHVLQYENEGFVRFLYTYLQEYWQLLRASGRWDPAARTAAYLAIAKECAAREAEHAYHAWAAHGGDAF